MDSGGVNLHVVFLPSLAPGHMIPLVQLARIFAGRTTRKMSFCGALFLRRTRGAAIYTLKDKKKSTRCLTFKEAFLRRTRVAAKIFLGYFNFREKIGGLISRPKYFTSPQKPRVASKTVAAQCYFLFFIISLCIL